MKAFLFFCSLVIIFMVSCHKESNQGTNTLTPKIKTLNIKWTVQAGGPATDNLDFKYDNSGRVIEIFGHNIIPGSGVPYDSIFLLGFEYSGNNTLPLRYRYQNFLTGQNELHFIRYNNNSQPIVDSSYFFYQANPTIPNFWNATTFTYSGNSIICRDSSSPNNSFTYHSLSIINDNFVFWGDYPTPNLQSNYYDFDTGINPLHLLNIGPVYYLFCQQNCPTLPPWSLWTLCNKNNITRVKRGYLPSSGTYYDTLALLKYDYDAAGLVQRRVWLYFGASTQPLDTITYIYQ